MYRIFGGRFILGPSNVKNKTALSKILDSCTTYTEILHVVLLIVMILIYMNSNNPI